MRAWSVLDNSDTPRLCEQAIRPPCKFCKQSNFLVPVFPTASCPCRRPSGADGRRRPGSVCVAGCHVRLWRWRTGAAAHCWATCRVPCCRPSRTVLMDCASESSSPESSLESSLELRPSCASVAYRMTRTRMTAMQELRLPWFHFLRPAFVLLQHACAGCCTRLLAQLCMLEACCSL